MMRQTYTTLLGEVLDLTDLAPEERAYFDRCVAAWRDGMGWVVFSDLVSGPENPLLLTTGGRITNAVWEHPLFQAVRDLEDRVGLAHGELTPDPGTDPSVDPLADEWLSTSQAVEVKGVAPNALHTAIKKGKVIARPAKEGGAWLLVSRRSLERWTPSAAHQAAKRRERAAG